MHQVRKPFQGVFNIIRFNWHFFVSGLSFAIFLLFFSTYFFGIPLYAALVIFTSILVSLSVSAYIYDFSNLYTFNWLPIETSGQAKSILNLNAGFDETSGIISEKYNPDYFYVFDFYNPDLHTEISIRRARKAYPPYPNTQSIKTTHIPLKDGSVDLAFSIFAAHEIRSIEGRVLFFKELHRVINTNGKLVITEHLRDIPNFLAYNFGFFHFFGAENWDKTFYDSNFSVDSVIKITPFVTTFILSKNGISS